jgi:c-di-GMP-binding flagellar brake protein YcgR
MHVPFILTVESESGGAATECSDVSLGGLSFVWKEKLPKGERIRVALSVKEKMFEIEGRVAYSYQDKKSGQFKSGIAFIDSPSAFRAKLAEEVFKIIDFRRTLSQSLGREVSEEEAARRWIEENAAGFDR